ncbi:hypothetical protein PVAG01_05038 [Phlyctema vagabunda]|uniref:Uncharacterized protein n=1 Tax=Phlyctema vagabunda TaxID=108571 RepID=A0ABR4PK23_9HELO
MSAFCGMFKGARVVLGLATLESLTTTPAHATMSTPRPRGRRQDVSVAIPAVGNNMGLRTHNTRITPSANIAAPSSFSQKQESSILKHIERLRASRAPTSATAQIPSNVFRRPSVPQTRKASATSSRPVSPPVSSLVSRTERSVSLHIERLSKARMTTPSPVFCRPSPPASRKVSPTMPAQLSLKTSPVVDLAPATQELQAEELVPSSGSLVTPVCDNEFESDIASVMPLGLRISKQTETTTQETPCQPATVDSDDLETMASVMPLGLKVNKKSEPAVPAPLDFNIDMDAMFSDMDLNLDLDICNATPAPVMPLALSFRKKKTVPIDVEQITAKIPELTIAPVTQLKSCMRQSTFSRTSRPKSVQWKNTRSDGRLVHEFKVFIPEGRSTFSCLEKVDITVPYELCSGNFYRGRPRVDAQAYQQFLGDNGEYIEVRVSKPEQEYPVPGIGPLACSSLSHNGEACCPHCRALANVGGLRERSVANQQTVMCESCLSTPSRRHLYNAALEEHGDEDHMDFCLATDSSHSSNGYHCEYMRAAARADARWYCDNFSDAPAWMMSYLG